MLSHAPAVYIPLPLFGDLMVPPLLLVWSANTLTFSSRERKLGQLYRLSWFDPDHYLLPKSHVRSRVHVWPFLLFKLCFTRDGNCDVLFLPGSCSEGKENFC